MSTHSFKGWPVDGPPHRRDVFVNRTLNLQRIEVIGFGEDRPVSVKPGERGSNRRAVIVVE